MSETEELIHKYIKNNPKEAKAMRNQEEALNVAVAVVKLQHDLHLSKRQFSKLVSIPYTTIARIEHGDMNPSSQLLTQIVDKAHKSLKI